MEFPLLAQHDCFKALMWPDLDVRYAGVNAILGGVSMVHVHMSRIGGASR